MQCSAGLCVIRHASARTPIHSRYFAVSHCLRHQPTRGLKAGRHSNRRCRKNNTFPSPSGFRAISLHTATYHPLTCPTISSHVCSARQTTTPCCGFCCEALSTALSGLCDGRKTVHPPFHSSNRSSSSKHSPVSRLLHITICIPIGCCCILA